MPADLEHDSTHTRAEAAPLSHSYHQTIIFRLLLGLALVVISHLATTPQTYPVVGEFNDKFNHLAAFYALALLADFAFPASPFDARKIAPLLAYGGLIETVQHFLPFRYFSLFDFCADGLGLALYLASLPLVKRLPWLRLRWRHAFEIQSTSQGGKHESKETPRG